MMRTSNREEKTFFVDLAVVKAHADSFVSWCAFASATNREGTLTQSRQSQQSDFYVDAVCKYAHGASEASV
jgi:hypothetical protein